MNSRSSPVSRAVRRTSRLLAGVLAGISSQGSAQEPPPVVQRPIQVVWGSYRNNEDLVDAGASQWSFVQQHMDAYLLHGAYWDYATNSIGSPSPDIIGPKLATLVNAHQKKVILEHGLAGLYPDIDSAFGSSAAGSPAAAAGFSSGIPNIKRLVNYGFPVPDISTDYIMEAWKQSVRFHPEWTSREFFTALTGSWETYGGSQFDPAPGSSERNTYGWFRQWVEGLAAAYPGIRVTSTNSPVYFNWDEGGVNRRELGGDLNNFFTWLKLERRGDEVTTLYSGDGKGWMPLASSTVPLGASPVAGMFVSSLDGARLAQARFDNVRVLPCYFADIGKTGTGGGLTVSGSTFTLESSGSESLHPGNNTSDAQFLAWKDWTGDGTFTVRLDSLAGSNPNRTNPAGEIASAGLMIRESGASNSRQVSLLANLANQLEFLSRATTGGGLSPVSGSGSPVASLGVRAAPRWLRLNRTGNSVTASHSPDGLAWTTLGATTVTFPAKVRIGLFADSQVRNEKATAVFTNADFLTPMTAAFAGSDIGSPGAGSTSSVSGSTFTLKSRGNGLAGTADSGRTHSTVLTGDGSFVARLAYFADDGTPASALPAGAQMGLTLRSDNTAGSAHVSVCFTPQLGLRALGRPASSAAAAGLATYGAGEVSIQPLGTNYRPLLHYFTGNDFMKGLHESFPGAFSANFAGFTTDSPYAGYQKWGGSETHADALRHRQKIILYERWLQDHGRGHEFIANSSGGTDFNGFDTGTQAGRDAWDLLYKQQSLRSIQLHQLEGGRPDKVLFESWYTGPHTMVPETQAGTFTNLVAEGIRYLKGSGQELDLSLRASDEASFTGDSIYQTSPSGGQLRGWRSPANAGTRSFVVRMTNRGSVDAYPVLHAHETGAAAGWSATYNLGGVDVSAAIRSASGLNVTDSTVRGSELVAPGAAVDLTVTITANVPASSREILIRAFWNPQDPAGQVRDAVRITVLPPDDPLLAGIAGDWPFDADLNDFSGLGRNLAATGAAAITPAPVKQGAGALDLSPSGSHASSQSALDVGEVFTISGWIHLPSGVNSIRTIMANSAGGSTTPGFRFQVNGYNTMDGKLVLETANGTQYAHVVSAAGAVAFDRWQHVAAVVDRGSGTATLYCNARVVASGGIRNDFPTNATLLVGAMGGAGFPLRGTLDDLRLHGRALSAAELGALAARSNDPPSITPPDAQTVAAGTTSAALPVAVGDAESTADSLVLTATSSDEDILPNANIVLGGSGASRTITVAPVAWSGGAVTVNLTLSDGLTETAVSFGLTVTNPGYPSLWTATGTSGSLPWTTASHWSQSRPAFPGSACELDFLTGSMVAAGTHVSQQERASPFTARRLKLGGNGAAGSMVRIDGDPISLVGNGTGTPAIDLNADAPLAYRIGAPIQFGANANITGNGGGSFEIASAWGGGTGILKSGASTIILSGDNSFTGFTDIVEGTVRVAHANALGAAAGSTRIQGGGSLAAVEFAGGISVAEPLRLVMHNSGSHSQVRNVSGDNTLTALIQLEGGGARWDLASLAGSLAITGNLANVVTGTDTWRTLYLRGPSSGAITGGVSDSANSRLNLTVLSGDWSLSGVPKAFTGNTRVEGGCLRVDAPLVSPVVLVSGTLQGAGGSTAGNLTLQSAARLSTRITDWNSPPPPFTAARLIATGAAGWVVRLDASGLANFTDAPRTVPVVAAGSFVDVDPALAVLEITGFPGAGNWSLQTTAGELRLVYQPDLYQTWSGSHAWNGKDSSPLADPDTDGLENLLEYALGGHPLEVSISALPVSSIVAGRLRLVFQRTADPLLIYQVEGSTDPASGSWSTVWSSTGAMNTPGTVAVDDVVSGPSPARRFLRLRVSR